ncbi:MAG: M48 family metalloprotease [Betaproteobacteria bacterium]|jgi:predicted Zn-dependent protease|nr:M48 family metalloprotease [Betaproteobacteria bacterium]
MRSYICGSLAGLFLLAPWVSAQNLPNLGESAPRRYGVEAPPAPATNLPDLGESSQAALSAADEREIGESIMRDIRSDPEYIDDPEIAGYVQALGQRLATASPVSRRHFEFFVIRNPQVNAFALPGGYIGIHSGLILTAQTESELASVVAHEIAHVEQRHMARMVDKQNQLQIASIAGLALAILAASSNPQVAQAAVITSQAAPLQAALSYSRDFEREADRVGFQILNDSGFDVHGMPTFFERMQRSTRLYENNAPGYLRTHPLTSDRIADMQNRALESRFRQVRDSVEFGLVRAKLRAEAGPPEDALAFFREALKDRRFTDEAIVHYGYAAALVRAKEPDSAAAEIGAARRAGLRNPMLETLAARAKAASGDQAGAIAILTAARKQYPANLGVAYDYADALLSAGRAQESLDVLVPLVRQEPHDPKLREMQARAYSQLGKRTEQHRALAEMYLLKGGLPAAIEQLRLAQKAGDADFYTLSAVDARLRELQRQYQSELRRRR